ncbi:hypothetical protein CARUB_v10019227mg [Capsella rubella]|uniref:RRM domain-containing protein n=1 Tax=Capsella rubella TaxID=81985 RepID=R0HKU2_9BRAS|nr:uncharacterized protein LOC17885823 [Capsella rubella]EOA25850.1 hypothetical protein CARUB_v10019227mg [Capsella rubella]
MGKEGKTLKRCSTSTDVEAEDGKGTKPLQKAEGELLTDVNPKKRKKKSKRKQTSEDDLEPKKKLETLEKKEEMVKLRKSVEEMTETMKNLQEFLMGNTDLPGMSLKEMLLTKSPDTSSKEEEPLEKKEKLATYECCFETEDSDGGHDDYTILARGLDTHRARDDMKNALREHFESLGCQVSRVFVPIECKTGARLGFAFIDVDEGDVDKALRQGPVGGWCLTLRADQEETYTFPNFRGCEHCGTFLSERRMKRFQTRVWRC